MKENKEGDKKRSKFVGSQISAWNSLFREIELTSKQGYSLVVEIGEQWQGTENTITGEITQSWRYEVQKDLGDTNGMITFISKNKKFLAYIGYIGGKTLVLPAYMAPEELKKAE